MTKRQDIEELAANHVEGRHDFGGVLLHLSPPSETLVVSCSGLVPEDRFAYAMENTTKLIETNKVFICDINNLWYYKGIRDITSSFDETRDLLNLIISGLSPKRVCFVGTSAGAYAAITFGVMTNSARALALAPQTAISTELRTEMQDGRWLPNMEAINKIAVPYDVRGVLRNNHETNCFVVYPRSDALDTQHAMRLADCPRTTLFNLNTEDHNVARFLLRANALQGILDKFIASDDAHVDADLAEVMRPLCD